MLMLIMCNTYPYLFRYFTIAILKILFSYCSTDGIYSLKFLALWIYTLKYEINVDYIEKGYIT